LAGLSVSVLGAGGGCGAGAGFFGGHRRDDSLGVVEMVDKLEQPGRLDSGPANRDPAKKIIIVTVTFDQIKKFFKRVFKC
jgi:hypothetical protein